MNKRSKQEIDHKPLTCARTYYQQLITVRSELEH